MEVVDIIPIEENDRVWASLCFGDVHTVIAVSICKMR